MNTLIKCPVEIKSACGRQGIGYSSINHVHIKNCRCFRDVKILVYKETITTKLDLYFRTIEDMDSEESIRFALNIEKHITSVGI